MLTFSEGPSFLITPEDREELGLSLGMEVSPELYQTITERAEYLRCRQKSLDLISRRDHSEGEIKQKLTQRQFSSKISGQVILELKGQGLLNDRRYAENFVSSRIRRKNDGPRKLLSALAAKGIDRSLAEEMVQRCFDQEEENRVLQRAIEKLPSKTAENPKKAAAALIRKGFAPNKVLSALEKLFGPFDIF